MDTEIYIYIYIYIYVYIYICFPFFHLQLREASMIAHFVQVQSPYDDERSLDPTISFFQCMNRQLKKNTTRSPEPPWAQVGHTRKLTQHRSDTPQKTTIWTFVQLQIVQQTMIRKTRIRPKQQLGARMTLQRSMSEGFQELARSIPSRFLTRESVMVHSAVQRI